MIKITAQAAQPHLASDILEIGLNIAQVPIVTNKKIEITVKRKYIARIVEQIFSMVSQLASAKLADCLILRRSLRSNEFKPPIP